MLDNPKVLKQKFLPSEGRLEGATVIGRCVVKGRIGACVGLVLVDEEDNRFVAYVFNDRIVTISEEPDGREAKKEEPPADAKKAEAKKQEQEKRK